MFIRYWLFDLLIRASTELHNIHAEQSNIYVKAALRKIMSHFHVRNIVAYDNVDINARPTNDILFPMARNSFIRHAKM